MRARTTWIALAFVTILVGGGAAVSDEGPTSWDDPDANCVMCHVDRTPGRGNDPRTHVSGFRNDRGDWHSNSGSVCFNCHTDTRQAGTGFCGYCHGLQN
jgi:hypothetical protein